MSSSSSKGKKDCWKIALPFPEFGYVMLTSWSVYYGYAVMKMKLQ